MLRAEVLPVVTTPLSDFTVRVALTPERVDYSVMNPSGADLRVTDLDHNVLPHELDTVVPGGVTTLWVRVPSLAAGTALLIHYGNALAVAPTAGEQEAAWGPTHVAVWHLDARLDDATSQPHVLVNHGVGTETGFIGDGRRLDGDRDWLDLPTNLMGSGQGSVNLWCQVASATVLPQIILHGTNSGAADGFGDHSEMALALSDAGEWSFYLWAQLDDIELALPAPLPDAGWHLLSATWSASDAVVRFYLDGTLMAEDEYVEDPFVFSEPMRLGRPARDDRYFDGSVDELRLSGAALSPGWIDAEYRSMTDTLLSYGP